MINNENGRGRIGFSIAYSMDDMDDIYQFYEVHFIVTQSHLF